MAIVFTVTLRDDGRVGIDGPLDDHFFCLGLLEEAKEAVRNYTKAKAAKAPLVQPVSVIPSIGPNGHRG